jgi:hypothetical protein
MNMTLAAVLAAIVLGGPFGEATVDGTERGDGMRIEFEVVVGGSPTAVVVHVVNLGEDQETVSLTDRGGGKWGSVADLDLINYVAVFEVLYADGDGDVSDPVTLLELGLDPAVLGMGEVTEPDEQTDEPLSASTLRWGWAAVALAAVALALLAVWAMGDRVGPAEDAEPIEGGAVDRDRAADGDQSAG